MSLFSVTVYLTKTHRFPAGFTLKFRGLDIFGNRIGKNHLELYLWQI